MAKLETIKNKYRAMRFNSIYLALDKLVTNAEENEITYLEFAEMLVNHELAKREDRRIDLNHKRSGITLEKHIEEFDFKVQTTITKKQITRLLDFSFIDNRENIIFIGPAGVGKSHLATGIGMKAIDAGYKIFFTSALDLIEALELAEIRGELKKKIDMIVKNDLLIIDELGFLPLTKNSVFNFFQLINTFYEFRSIIITTNKDFTNWCDFFGEEDVAVPIIDRIIHHSHIFMMGGESYRLKEKKGKK